MHLRTRLLRPNRAQRGFSILTVLVGTALGLAAVGTFATFGRFQLMTMLNEANRIDLQTNARNAIDLFTAEVRVAGANPSCIPNFSGIADAKQQRLRIFSDLNGDGVITGPTEDVTYEYKFSFGKFERVAYGMSDALVTDLDLTGSRIRYFDGAGVEITAGATGLSSAQRDEVRRIRIELVLAKAAADPENPSTLQVKLANNIDLRNRYFIDDVECP